jgi:hypothetical protein
VGIRVTHLLQQAELHALQQFGVVLSEGGAGRQVKSFVCTLGQADQPGLDGRGELAGAQRQRGRLVVEGVDHVGTIRPGQAVVQGQERSWLDKRGGGIHGGYFRQAEASHRLAAILPGHLRSPGIPQGQACPSSRTHTPRTRPTMKDLPADQRPREKLLARGAAALATPNCWRCCCAPATAGTV